MIFGSRRRIAVIMATAALAAAWPFAAVAFASVRHTAELPTSFVAVAGDSVGSDHRSRGRIASDSNRDGVVHVRDIRSIAPHFRSRKDHDVSVEDVNGDGVADISDR